MIKNTLNLVDNSVKRSNLYTDNKQKNFETLLENKYICKFAVLSKLTSKSVTFSIKATEFFSHRSLTSAESRENIVKTILKSDNIKVVPEESDASKIVAEAANYKFEITYPCNDMISVYLNPKDGFTNDDIAAELAKITTPHTHFKNGFLHFDTEEDARAFSRGEYKTFISSTYSRIGITMFNYLPPSDHVQQIINVSRYSAPANYGGYNNAHGGANPSAQQRKQGYNKNKNYKNNNAKYRYPKKNNEPKKSTSNDYPHKKVTIDDPMPPLGGVPVNSADSKQYSLKEFQTVMQKTIANNLQLEVADERAKVILAEKPLKELHGQPFVDTTPVISAPVTIQYSALRNKTSPPVEEKEVKN